MHVHLERRLFGPQIPLSFGERTYQIKKTDQNYATNDQNNNIQYGRNGVGTWEQFAIEPYRKDTELIKFNINSS